MNNFSEKIKKAAIETGLGAIKFVLILKRIIGGFFNFFGKALKFLFGPALYRVLIKIYYQVFRLRRSGTIKKSPLEILGKHPVYIFIFLIIGSLLTYNIENTEHAGAMAAEAPKAALSGLVKNEFSDSQDEELIEETGTDLSSLSSADKYENDSCSLNKDESLQEGTDEDNGYSEFNDENDMVIKPPVIDEEGAEETGKPSENNPASAPAKRTETIYYTVEDGDTISSIARHFGITSNTILWANNLDGYSLIHAGQKLAILPASGVLYEVKRGDTLAEIASTYNIDVDKIIAENDLGDGLRAGEKIVLPGASRIKEAVEVAKEDNESNSGRSGLSVIKNIFNPKPAPANISGSGKGMIWPTVGHNITQYFSWQHDGVDIANKIGTPIYAAADGVVEIARGGYNGGYGNTILLDHPNGLKTRYGHASKLLVSPGDSVKKGQVIALMGSTGHSTGPHLHFEVLTGKTRYNPLNYVK